MRTKGGEVVCEKSSSKEIEGNATSEVEREERKKVLQVKKNLEKRKGVDGSNWLIENNIRRNVKEVWKRRAREQGKKG